MLATLKIAIYISTDMPMLLFLDRLHLHAICAYPNVISF